MIRKISVKLAANFLLALFIGALLFHILVLSSAIPFSYVWGGGLEETEQMRQFETIAIVVNLFIIVVTAIKAGHLKAFITPRVLSVTFWILVLVFSANTLGNIVAITSLEAMIATPITLISAILCYRLAIDQPDK